MPRLRTAGSPICPASAASAGIARLTTSERGDVGVPGHRADDHARRPRRLMPLSSAIAAEIDSVRGLGEAQLQGRDQASCRRRAACASACRRAAARRRRRLLARVIVEFVHRVAPLMSRGLRLRASGSPATRFSRRRRHVDDGARPAAYSASRIAFITAAGAPIAPASPQPLTPSGLCVHGVTWVATVKDGRSSARGIA